ncbi:YIP1 family protein [Candidatus Margulisiibacteriota bacterium]
MINLAKAYLDVWWKVMLRPIFFFQDMPEGKWSEAALTFMLATSWILSFGITLAIFIIMYIPTGLNLIEGLKGRELVLATPVLLLMGVVFFIMTILIVALFVIAVLLALSFAVAGILNALLILLGGASNFSETLKAVFYSNAIFLMGLFTVLFAVMVKWQVLSFDDWLVGESTLFYASAVYLYGLWSIAGKKVHGVSRWKAFLAAVFPFLVLVIVNIFLSMKVLPKIETWIS